MPPRISQNSLKIDTELSYSIGWGDAILDTSVEDVPWIAKETAPKLRNGHINTITQLALTSSASIIQCGIPAGEASHLIREARMRLRSFQQGDDLLRRGDDAGIIKTGSSSLDQLLGGGAKGGAITSIFGPSGSGKTQLCFALSYRVQLSIVEGGLDSEVAFIDTTGTFRPERIAELASLNELDPKSVLRRISVFEARNPREQINAVAKIQSISRIRPIRLLVIDTLTENFMYHLEGRDKLIKKQSLLAKHLHDLALIAIRESIAVVVTNPVRDRLGSRIAHLVEAGGRTVSQGAHIKLSLSSRGRQREASLIYPSSPQNCCFKIESRGISNC